MTERTGIVPAADCLPGAIEIILLTAIASWVDSGESVAECFPAQGPRARCASEDSAYWRACFGVACPVRRQHCAAGFRCRPGCWIRDHWNLQDCARKDSTASE